MGGMLYRLGMPASDSERPPQLTQENAMQNRLWRVFGILAIAHIVLMFGALVVEGMTPALGSSRSDLVKGLVHGGLTSRFAGGYVEALSMIVFLVAALLLARLLRGSTETTGWLASCMGATATITAGSALIVGFPAGAAAIYDGHHGAGLATIATMNDLRNFAFFLSVAVEGVFILGAGAGMLVSHTLPRWLAWAGIAVGVGSVISVAGAGSGMHDIGNLAQLVWWVVLGVVALRYNASAAKPGVRSRDAVTV
jgi:hypothetical protein